LPRTGILVGVSGGPDSMALLHVLKQLNQAPLKAAHLNHGLRPGDCDADEQLVRAFCQEQGIELVAAAVDVKEQARQTGLGLEAAGREARRQFFREQACQWLEENPELDEVRIALAHHLDDQAETILLHLGRGCGTHGLAGMAPRTGPFIRPLLGVRRAAIRDYLTQNQVPWRQDATNDEPFTLRNRLRLDVLPAFSAALGYDVAPALARTADLARADETLLAELARQAWERVAMPVHPLPGGINRDGALWPGHRYYLSRPKFASEPEALQYRLLRLSWRKTSGETRDIEWRHLRLARELILEDRARGHLDWPRGVALDLEGPLVCFHGAEPRQTEDSPANLTKNGNKVSFDTRICRDGLV
jgi:tRNA(Ile)-lysidine synthase